MESAYHGANWYALVVSNNRHHLRLQKMPIALSSAECSDSKWGYERK